MPFCLINAQAADLIDSTLKKDATLQAGNQSITLKFNEEFDPFRVRILLFGSDRLPILIPATATLDHKAVQANINAKIGDYTLQWHVWSWKGTESSGSIPFHVTDNPSNYSTANFNPNPAIKGQIGKAAEKAAVSNSK